MNLSKFIVACCYILLLIFSNQALSAQCKAVFPDVIATHGNGVSNSQINFGLNARLVNNPDTELSTRRISDNPGSTFNTCGSANCTASNISAETVSVNFRRGGGNISFNTSRNRTFGTTSVNNYNRVTANSNVSFFFSDRHNVYFFERLSLGFNNTLNLKAGKTYYIRQLLTNSNVKINVVGSGTAQVFIDSAVNFSSNNIINSAGSNSPGDASKLVMHVNGNVRFNSGSTFTGGLYAKNIDFISTSYLFGVASGQRVNINSSSILTYDSNVFNADFGELCDESAEIIANFQFDKCSYTGIGNEIIDQTGNFNASISGISSSSSNAIINRSLDLSAAGTSDWVTLPNETIDGLNDFSLSVWINTTQSKVQQEIFQALGSNASDDELEIYLINSSVVNVKVRNSAQQLSAGLNVTDGQWHHLVVTRVDQNVCLYVDGVERSCGNSVNAGTLSVPNNNAAVIGQEQDSFGGSFTSQQSFEGQIDELIIYNGKLTTAEIATLYTRQLNNRNYDNTLRDPVSCSALLAFYQFEQTDFSSQINDTSSSDNHAENIFGGLSTADGKYCRGFESESWNNYNGITDAFRAGLDLDDDVGLRGTISFWFNSSINWNQGSERVLFDASSGSNATDKYFVFEIRQDGRLKFAFEDSVDSDFSVIESSSNSRQADTWYYLTVTWDYLANDFAIYVDGDLQVQQTKNTNGAMGELQQIVFGDNSSNYTQAGNSPIASPYSSRGNYDEVRVYNKVLTQSEIQADMNESFGCNVIDHFEIDTLNAQGITCEADDIIIKACADASCSTVNPDAVDVKLSINGVENKTVTVSGNNGTSTSYSYTAVGNAELSLDQDYECLNGSPTLCDVTFSDTGFRFITGTDDLNLPVQLSGKPSDVGFHATTLKVEAVKADPLNPEAACAPLLVTGQSIEMAASYQSPSTGSVKVNISGQDIGTAINGTSFDSLPFTAVPLDFGNDTQNSAEYIFTYSDAGSVILNARYELPDDDDGNPSGDFIKGASNPIIVRPFAFHMLIDNNLPTGDTNYKVNPKATDGTGDVTDVFTVAAGEIRISTRAVAWKAGNDENANGLADQGEDLTSNITTKNFTNVILDSLAYTQVKPSTGVGVLTVVDGGAFNAGIKIDTAKYDEVGIISLTTLQNDYLAAGVSINGSEPYVGRFTPAYFTQTVNYHGSLNANHYDICKVNNWVYAGQTRVNGAANDGAILYGGIPVIDINAYNLDGALTKNYTDAGFMKLDQTGIDITLPIADDEQLRLEPSVLGETVELSSVMTFSDDLVSMTEGVISYTFNATDHFIYEHTKNSKLKPFEAKIPFIINSVQDSDTINLYDSAIDPVFDPVIVPTEKVITEGVEIRFGRWLLENSYGPETSSLPVTMFTQHFDGNNFINNDRESCLVPVVGDLDPAGDIGEGGMSLWNYRIVDPDTTDGLFPVDTTPSLEDTNKRFVSGLYQWLQFSAPGVNNQGELEMEYQVPPWLQYDWDGDGDFINNPTTNLTFGIYRGNDRIIYQREISR